MNSNERNGIKNIFCLQIKIVKYTHCPSKSFTGLAIAFTFSLVFSLSAVHHSICIQHNKVRVWGSDMSLNQKIILQVKSCIRLLQVIAPKTLFKVQIVITPGSHECYVEYSHHD